MTEFIDWKQKTVDTLRHGNDPASHAELDPTVFHPSYLGLCKRMMLIRKLNLEVTDDDALGRFHPGNMIHRFMQDEVAPSGLQGLPDSHEVEEPIEYHEMYSNEEVEAVLDITGSADYVDHDNNVVYDFKSRAGFYNFNGPKDKHIVQLLAYVRGLEDQYDAEYKGKLVYVSKKQTTDIRPFPGGDQAYTMESHGNKYLDALRRASEVMLRVQEFRNNPDEYRDADMEDVIGFDECGRDDCYPCNHVDHEWQRDTLNKLWGDS